MVLRKNYQQQSRGKSEWEVRYYYNNKLGFRHLYVKLEDAIDEVYTILYLTMLESEFLKGNFVETYLTFKKTYHHKRYVIDIGFPPVKIMILKKTAGNIEVETFVNKLKERVSK